MRTKIFLFTFVAFLGLALTAFVQSFSLDEPLQTLSLLEFQEATAGGCIALVDCCKKPKTGNACICAGQIVISISCENSGEGCSAVPCDD